MIYRKIKKILAFFFRNSEFNIYKLYNLQYNLITPTEEINKKNEILQKTIAKSKKIL